MNISYNWLKEYVDFDLTPDEVAAALTSIGLETGSVEEVQTIKGGLEGLVIGEVLTCEAHPNSDHMHVTTVNLGQGEPVQIVSVQTTRASSYCRRQLFRVRLPRTTITSRAITCWKWTSLPTVPMLAHIMGWHVTCMPT